MKKEHCSNCFSTVGPFTEHGTGKMKVRLCKDFGRECIRRAAERRAKMKANASAKKVPQTHTEMVMAWTGCTKDEVAKIDTIMAREWSPSPGLSNLTRDEYRRYSRIAYEAYKIDPSIAKERF